jgi:hypothetical protein
MTFPKNEFFDDKQFGARLSTFFHKANMSMEQSNAFLRTTTPAVNKLVEERFLRK